MTAPLPPLAVAPVAIALLGAALTFALGRGRPRRAGRIALTTAGACLAVAVAGAAAGGGTAVLPWAPGWGSPATFALDPAGALMAIATAGVGLAVLLYSRGYMPAHLEAAGRPRAEQTGYYGWMVLFMGAMIGVATARGLLLLFVFFELTAVCSYVLIGFDEGRSEARRGALMALLVTGTTTLALLVAALLLWDSVGTFDLAALEKSGAGTAEWAAALVVVAALGKSAQPPLHFWLPRAMAAPTPVSAYLHSAAMVTAGVFLLLRVAPLLEGTAAGAALPWLGGLGVAVGGTLALGADVLKQLLAYSTVAQHGFMVLLVGWGVSGGPSAESALAGAALFLAVHAPAKSALFMTAGAVTRATGESRLSRLGGLAGRLPRLALFGGLAAAALAGLPLTAGWFKDEAVMKTALEHGPAAAAATAAGVALTVAYMARFWGGIFAGGRAGGGAGRERPRGERVGAALWTPVALLAVATTVGGLLPGALASAANAAAGEGLHLSYGLHPSTGLAAAAYLAAALLYLYRGRWWRAARGLHRVERERGPEAWYEWALGALNRLSDRAHAVEVRDLRDRMAALLVPALLLVAAAVAWIGVERWTASPLRVGQTVLVTGLAVAGLVSVAVTRQRALLPLVLALTAVGYTLAAVYALIGAGDVALVAGLVETTLSLLFLAVLSLVRFAGLREPGERPDIQPPEERRRDVAAAVLGGAVAFVVAWTTLSVEAGSTVATLQAGLAKRVHADDPVIAILTEFRALDTLGEITVLAAALLGLRSLLPSPRPPAAAPEPWGEDGEPGGGVTLPRLVARWVLPPTLVVAIAFLVLGHTGTGGGFPGALVGAAGVLYAHLAFGPAAVHRMPVVRFAPHLCGAGVLLALLVGFGPALLGEPPLVHFPAGGEAPGIGSLRIHSGFVFEAGVFLATFGFVVHGIDAILRSGGTVPDSGPGAESEAGADAAPDLRSRPGGERP